MKPHIIILLASVAVLGSCRASHSASESTHIDQSAATSTASTTIGVTTDSLTRHIDIIADTLYLTHTLTDGTALHVKAIGVNVADRTTRIEALADITLTDSIAHTDTTVDTSTHTTTQAATPHFPLTPLLLLLPLTLLLLLYLRHRP